MTSNNDPRYPLLQNYNRNNIATSTSLLQSVRDNSPASSSSWTFLQVIFVIGWIIYSLLLIVVLLCLFSAWISLIPARLMYFELEALSALAVLQFCVSVVLSISFIFLQDYLVKEGYLLFRTQLTRDKYLFLLFSSLATCGSTCTIFLPEESRDAIMHLLLFLLAAQVAGQIAVTTRVIYIAFKCFSLTAEPDAAAKLRVSTRAVHSNSDANVDSVLITQSDLIEFQEEHIRRLSTQILRLREQQRVNLQKEELPSTSVETRQLIAVKEAENDALVADKQQLKTELERTRIELAEQLQKNAATIQTNEQFMEENNRLRLILDEWSSRSVKLEIAIDRQLQVIEDLESQLNGSSGRSQA